MIHRQELRIDDGPQVLNLPRNARVLSAGKQRGKTGISLWYQFRDGTPEAEEPRTFIVLGTGEPEGENLLNQEFIGTVIDDPFVWHVFEILRDV